MYLKIAHRGASAYEPENTLRAFRKAIGLGAGMIELDVRLSQGRTSDNHARRNGGSDDGWDRVCKGQNLS